MFWRCRIDPTGIVTGVKDGTTTIVAETKSGAKGELSVTVGELQRGEIRFEVSNDHPMYLENYYWSDDAPRKDGLDANKNYYGDERVDSPVMLYNTVPDVLKDNTVILLINCLSSILRLLPVFPLVSSEFHPLHQGIYSQSYFRFYWYTLQAF